MDKNPPANAGDMGSIPGLGRFHVLHLATAKPCATTTECSHPRAGDRPREKPLQ